MLEALLLALFGIQPVQPEPLLNPNLKRVNEVQVSRERNFVQYAEQKINNPVEFKCFDELMHRESSWKTKKDPQFAQNPKSSAYGIPQSLPGNKMASMGADWRTNPETQIKWGLKYIKHRYETPCGAWGAFKQKGWY
jgi:hypothetical protein